MTGIELRGTVGQNGYDLAIKVKYDASGRIVSGFAIGETTPQNQAVLLAAHKGEFKEYPLLGIGLSDIVNDHNYNEWKRKITEQLESDGQRIERLEINEHGLTLDACYK